VNKVIAVLATSGVLITAVSARSENVKRNCEFLLTTSVPPLPRDLVQFPPQTKWMEETTADSLNRIGLDNISAADAKLKSFNYKKAIQKLSFQRGNIYNDGGNLIWETSQGEKVTLADKANHPGRGITAISISPDGSKVAYSTTLNSSDQHVWYVKTISRRSRHILAKPILVRMDGFSWSKDNRTVYYSHFSKIEDVLAGRAPIDTIRSRDIFSGKDLEVFDHGFAANFAIADVDGGNTLIAHRILGPGSGIKALLSVYLGKRKTDKNGNAIYDWKPLIEPNSVIGHFLGLTTLDGHAYAIMQSNRFSPRYGIVGVPIHGPLNSTPEAVDILVPSSKYVLHNSQMIQDRLFLEYFDPKTLESVMRVVNVHTPKQVEKEIKFSDYGLLNNGTLNLPASFNGPEVTFRYEDVLNNIRIFSYNLANKSVQALANPEPNPFDTSGVRVEVVSYPSQDGTIVRALKIYKLNKIGKVERPKFIFAKAYGMIGIKYANEPSETLLSLDAGGMYFVMDIRGGAGANSNWQVQGSRNFDLRFQDIAAGIHYLTKLDPTFKGFNLDPKESVVLLGRSYNGSGVLEMAAKYKDLARIYVSVAPVLDTTRQMHEARFGVIAHSDRFPKLDPDTHDLILDDAYWASVEQHNPSSMINNIPGEQEVMIFTGGSDDRIDGLTYEEGIVRKHRDHLGSNLFYLHNMQASHVTRWYFEEVFGRIYSVFGK
jgi:protease II